jgi:hypothetical protein
MFIEPPKDIWFVMDEYLPPPYGIIQLTAYLERKNKNVKLEILDCNTEKVIGDRWRSALPLQTQMWWLVPLLQHATPMLSQKLFKQQLDRITLQNTNNLRNT